MTVAASAVEGDYLGESVPQEGIAWAGDAAVATHGRFHLGHLGAGSVGGVSTGRCEPRALGREKRSL